MMLGDHFTHLNEHEVSNAINFVESATPMNTSSDSSNDESRDESDSSVPSDPSPLISPIPPEIDN